ncbi:MAG TPA: LD-carboxypeptidase [Longimicrobiales bacterium]|nr:LD-carboxypeptidase [Longimicrobiales bacterium]
MNRQAVLRPKALAPGARVALVAPAGPLAPERIDASLERCRSLGLEPVLFPGAAGRHRFLAGTDEQRLADLQAAFDDPAIDAIWALRGGYGTVRVLAKLDLGRQRTAPIPFIGFSDNTTIHARHAALGVVSFHGPHPGGDFPPETEKAFVRVLFSAEPAGALNARSGDPEPRALTGGRAEGRLVGGNLSLLASLCGSADAPRARDALLFLEDVGEPAYRVDRMLHQLERAGVTDGVRALAFGRFTEPPDEELHPVVDTLREFAERLRVPAIVDLPFGHVEHNCTLPVGCRARLDADEASLSIIEPAVNDGIR